MSIGVGLWLSWIGVRFGWILVVIEDSWGWYYDVE